MTNYEKLVYNTITEEEPYCMLCGKGYTLQRHHIRYGKEGRHTYFENVIILCMQCHQMVHSNKKKWQPFLIKLANEHEKKMNRGEVYE